MDDATRLLRVGEVAERLNLSRSATYELLTTGRIPSIAVSAGGRSRRVRATDLRQFIDGLEAEPLGPSNGRPGAASR